MTDFLRGNETPNTLHNLLRVLQRRRTSYLAQAIATDVDLYERTQAKHPGRRAASAPDLVEVGLAETLLMGMHELLQQIAGFTAGHKKPKVKRLPRPRTAADEYRRREARAQFEHFEQVLNFVPQEQFEQTIRQAQGGE